MMVFFLNSRKCNHSEYEYNTAIESLYGYSKTVKFVEGNLIDGTEEHIRTVDRLLDTQKLI